MTSVPHELSSIEVVRIVVSSRILNNWLKSNYSFVDKGSTSLDSFRLNSNSITARPDNKQFDLIWFNWAQCNFPITMCSYSSIARPISFLFWFIHQSKWFFVGKNAIKLFFFTCWTYIHIYIYIWYHILYP